MRFTPALFALAVLLNSCADKEPRAQNEKQEQTVQQPQSAALLVAHAKEKLAEAKERLAQEGKYACCVKDPCNHCALHEGSCDCFKDLQAGEHVCIECYSEWQQGKGAVEKVKKETVKTDFVKHEHKAH